jgi:hypothetical protein
MNYQLVVRVFNQILKKIMKNVIQHLGVTIAMSVIIIASSCTVSVSGETVKEERALSNFSAVNLAVPADLYLSQGDSYSFTIEGDKNFLAEIITEVKGNTLVIKTEGWINTGWGNRKVQIHITMPEVEELAVAGSGDIEAKTPIQAKDLTAKVSGSGDIFLPKLDVVNLDIFVSGSGDVEISGDNDAQDVKVRVTGSGDVNLNSIQFENAEVSISGSGDVYLVATESLKARVVGSGDVVYSGNPLVDGKVTGSGHIQNK